MSRLRINLGVLISSTGAYSVVSKSMMCGALLAIEEVHKADIGVEFLPTLGDPGGRLNRYSELAAEMLSAGVRHVVGCYTSSSRKEIIPLFEKMDALLWYPSHYEGFESSGNVVYTGAVANQHLLPLVDYALQRFGGNVFCVGSNYIWAWGKQPDIARDDRPRRWQSAGGAIFSGRFARLHAGDCGDSSKHDPLSCSTR